MKRALIFTHRWLGVALCLLFLLWFPSGIGMMYWDYPGITAEHRQQRSPNLDPSSIAFSPVQAYAALGIGDAPAAVVLGSYDGRPIYRFTDGEGESLVYADTGEQQVDVTPALMRRVAAAWAGQRPDAASVEPIAAVDQWTLQIPFRELQPLWRYTWESGDHVYVSQVTGEVVQHTTTASRLGAYLGPIPHWFYFTPLRRNGPVWSGVVIWTSALATLTATLGLAVGAWMYSPRRRYRSGRMTSSIPYAGQKRWHMVLGLCFGIGAVTWAFSGMLSMDPFPPAPEPGAREIAANLSTALRGRPVLAAFADRDPRQALSLAGRLPVKELELLTLADEPVYLAALSDGTTVIVPVHGTARGAVNQQRLDDVVRAGVQPARVREIRSLSEYDAYYLDRRGRQPLPVLLVQLDDAAATRYYVDPKTGNVVGSYSARRWVSRWLYHGLHSLNFPWLYNARPLWDVVMIVFMLGGTALGVTSFVLAWRVLGRLYSRV